MNKIQFIGRSTKDLELKISSKGVAYTTISIAVDDRGNEKQPVDFFDIKAFGKVADILVKFVKKGTQLFIEAKAKQNVYEKEDGTKNYTIDFVLNEFELLGSKPNDETNEESTQVAEADKSDIPF